ncbi:MAG TPA: polysaccharide biosynthesis protein [Aeromicrobium sp.]|nr:polysaccharide biosynthesis protein [Aeromicrobium sp.]
MTTPRAPLTGGALIAGAMMISNVAVYGFSVAAARMLLPAELGAVTALLGLLLMGSVLSLGLQAATARRIAVDPDHRDDICRTTVRVVLVAGCLMGAIVAASTFVLSPALKLGSPWAVVLCGVVLLPLTVMGAAAGIAQGTGRWRTLAAIYVANGAGRFVGGVVALMINPSAPSAMIGIAVGALLPVLAGWPVLRGHVGGSSQVSSRPFVREAVLGSHTLLAFFVLSNLDVLIARNLFEEHTSGLYAAGVILAKAALFTPQFVSVVLFPDLARATDRSTRTRALAAVAGIGAVTVLGTFALSSVALALVGGDQYVAIQDRLWLFALSGAMLSIVHLLVFDALARHRHGVGLALWLGSAALLAAAYGLDVDLTGLVVTVIAVATALATWTGLNPRILRGDAPVS